MYLKELQRDRQIFYLLVRSPKWLQELWLLLARAWNPKLYPGLLVAVRVLFCCFPRQASRELAWKWISWDLNQHCSVGYQHHMQQLNPLFHNAGPPRDEDEAHMKPV